MTALASPPERRRAKIIIGRAFLPVLHSTDSFVLVESPRGCLKTCSHLNILMSRAYRWPGKRWYLWRSTRTLLSTTIMPSFEDYVIPAWNNVPGMRLMNPNAGPSNRTDYTFENGSMFIPVGLDDLLRGTSAEGAGGYLAEAVELHSRDQVVALVGMMRQPGVPHHQIILDVNPGPPGHFTNHAAEPIDNALRKVVTREDYERLQTHNRAPTANPRHLWKRIVAKIQDNPFYFDVDKWETTPAGKAYLDSLGTLTGHLYSRWVLGEWQAAEGGVFREFGDRNQCDPFPDGWPSDWPVIVGYDSGYDHPAAIVFYGIAPNGTPYIFDEIYRSALSLEEIGTLITVRAKGLNVVRWLADPRDVFKRTAHASGKTIASFMLEQFKIRFEPWPMKSGDIVHNQVEAVRNLIRDAKKPLQVWNTCKSTISEFQSWSYKRMADGSQGAGDDAYEDKNNHAIDCILGIVATNPTFDRGTVHVHNNS